MTKRMLLARFAWLCILRGSPGCYKELCSRHVAGESAAPRPPLPPSRADSLHLLSCAAAEWGAAPPAYPQQMLCDSQQHFRASDAGPNSFIKYLVKTQQQNSRNSFLALSLQEGCESDLVLLTSYRLLCSGPYDKC